MNIYQTVSGKTASPTGDGAPDGTRFGAVSARLLSEFTDPFALEVHRPVHVEDLPLDLPALPQYVPRDHDQALKAVVQAAAMGISGIAVLVGTSSTGKTRACWEALNLLRGLAPPWRLWHPIDPSRPEAALRELPAIGCRTVIWLNDAQFYIDGSGGSGERIAAGLRELLRDPGRSPVLVLATLWPEFWDNLTARPDAEQDDPHAQARELLSGRDITVPSAFNSDQVQKLAGAADPRLAMAAEARDGQVAQFLAGAPELLARYRNAPAAAAALISAAIDGRRLGMSVALPQSFLEAAAQGYLTDDQWDRLNDNWPDEAFDYAAADAKGARGPLTRIRPRPSQQGAPALDAAYRLADYLDQYGRQSRRSIIPPAQFWEAAAAVAASDDLGALARAAESRGLLRDAAIMRKRAGANGDTRATASLIATLHALKLDGTDLARWAAAHANLDDPGAVVYLLWALRNAEAEDQAITVLTRDPANAVELDNPHAIGQLLWALRRMGATEQVEILSARAAAQVNVGDPYSVMRLLRTLGRLGHAHQFEILAARVVADVNLDESRAVAALLETLSNFGATDQTTALLARDPTGRANLDDPRGVAPLLRELRKVGQDDQANALAARVVAHASISDSGAIARMLKELQEAGAADVVQDLLARDPAAHADLDDPGAVAVLLTVLHNKNLRKKGGSDQIKILLARDPAAHSNPGDPRAVAGLLRSLHNLRAKTQIRVLAVRAAAHVGLDDADGIAALLETLTRVRAVEPLGALLAREPAAHVSLDNPGGVAALLEALHKVGATDQAKVLLARDPATYVDLYRRSGITRLLRELQASEDADQYEALTARLPAAGLFDIFCTQATNQETYRYGRQPDGRASPAWDYSDIA